MQRPVGFNSL